MPQPSSNRRWNVAIALLGLAAPLTAGGCKGSTDRLRAVDVPPVVTSGIDDLSASTTTSSAPLLDGRAQANRRYEVALGGSHRSPSSVRRKNPLTGKDVDVHEDVQTAEELREVEALLAHYAASDDGHRVHTVDLTGGARIDVVESAREEPGAGPWQVAFHGDRGDLGAEETNFLFDLASAGGFVIETDDRAIVTKLAVKRRMPDSVLARSPEELRALLRDRQATSRD